MISSVRIAFLLLAVVAWGTPAGAAPKAEIWAFWTAQDESSQVSVDHSAWSGFLARYVRPGSDSINRVAYGVVTAADREMLDTYIESLVAVPVRALSRAEQRPYWVNLYNALTLRVVLQHYPVDSIRDIDISPGFFADGPWGKTLVEVEGVALSLDDIEHRILRPIWRDPRIHYAVNCASLGCPDLQRRAMTARNAEDFLDAGAAAFINHPRGARLADGKLYVSSIYDWFEADFGGNDAGVIAHLRQYAAADLAAALSKITRIEDDYYDWRLNGTAGP